LAASDLTRLIDSYGGTTAADEAVVMLAQVRLLQEQPQEAVTVLERALETGLDEQFESAALGLLGAALEDLDRMSDAGQAYERAAQASWYEFLAAQYLIDAGRAHWSAGDTAAAVAAYQRIVNEFPESPSALEAKVRLGELTRAGVGTAS
jgi:outer membrane protein assembly factor BamD (BamD/ComL family)